MSMQPLLALRRALLVDGRHTLTAGRGRIVSALGLLLLWFQLAGALDAAPLRRPVSPTSPMYLVQVDGNVNEDPQAAINAVPADIRPYVVMMMCIPGKSTNGPTIADDFCNVCYANGMWAMVQVSSGVTNTFSNTDTAGFEMLYKKYPNLIGFCFAEQNWGFDSTSFATRLQLFANLLALGDTYGGYLYINEMQSISNKSWNTVAKFKSSAAFANATVTYKANFILGSKFTMGYGFYDNESGCLGAFLSGHAGNYAVRYDQYSWGYTGRGQLFGAETLGTHNDDTLAWFTCPEGAMGAPIIDHMMLQGAAVLDGPEVPWVTELYKGKRTPVFNNMICDIFRKVLDKTIKIPALPDVLANTPIAYVADKSSNVTGATYNGVNQGLYADLYQMDGDGKTNYTWFKKTGRYSSIPELFTANSYETAPFATFVRQSQYTTRWPTEQAKIDEFNSYFPEQYTGDMFVSRRENRWFAYNPWLNQDTATSASIPLRYNTCATVGLNFPAHTLAVLTEDADAIQVYLNNYRTDKDGLWQQHPNGMSWTDVQNYVDTTFTSNPPDNTSKTIRTSTIQVTGCTTEPTFTLTDRGIHPASLASSTFANGTFTLTVTGNGPADITINCSGAASRPSVPAGYALTVPPIAPVGNAPPATPPSALATAVSGTQVSVSWTASARATSYNVYRSTNANGTYARVATGIAGTSYVDGGLTSGLTYYYVVTAVNAYGESSFSSAASATVIAPVLLLPEADAYVRASTFANTNFGSDTQLAVKNDTTFLSNTRESYLRFNVGSLPSALKVELQVVPENVGSNPTLAFELVNDNSWGEKAITWNNKPAGSGTIMAKVSGFVVGRAVRIDLTSYAKAAAASTGYLSIRIYSQTAGTTPLVFFGSKEDANAANRPLLVWTPQPPPAAPGALSAMLVAADKIDVAWTAVSGATSYHVKRAADAAGPFTTIATVTGTEYVDSGLAAGTTYYYVVSALNAGGESADSAVDSERTPAVPVITSATTLSGTYGQAITYAITATELPDSFSAVNLPPGLGVDLDSGIVSGTPTAAGTYTMTVGATNLAGTGTADVTVTIAPAPAMVTVNPTSTVYDGAAHAASVATVPAGLAVAVDYSGSATPPRHAGSYAVTATIVDPNYFGQGSGTLTILKAAPAVAVTPYAVIYDGAAHTATGGVHGVSGETLAGLDLSGTTHTGAGAYVDAWTFTDATGDYLNAAGHITDSIDKAVATIALAPLAQHYDGTPRAVTASTLPAGLTVDLTYDGAASAPIYPGAHIVVGTIDDPNYTGSAKATLTIGVTALVRHMPKLSGDLDGSAQVLSAENVAVNGQAMVSGDLLAPGAPTVVLNGTPTYGGTLDGTGDAAATYLVTLDGGTVVRHVVRRIDAIALPTVSAPKAPTGTRNVVLNRANEAVGDFATLRNLTLNGNAGHVAVPPGTYGSFTLAASSGLVLGTAGATEPAVYEFASLTLNGSADIQVAGPAIVRVANGMTVNGNVGAADHSDWLTLEVAAGGLTLNGGATFNGNVVAPSGTVILNGGSTLRGSVSADALTLNGNAALVEPSSK